MAWDQQEKEPVAGHLLVQPAMRPVYQPAMRLRADEDPALASYHCESFPTPGSMVARLRLEHLDDRYNAAGPRLTTDAASLRNWIQEFIKAVSDMPRGPELEEAFRELLTWLDKNCDPTSRQALRDAIDRWRGHVDFWNCLYRDLSDQGLGWADHLEQAAAMLRNPSRHSGSKSFYDDFGKALSQPLYSGATKSMAELLAQLDRWELAFLESLKQFVRQQAYISPGAAAPSSAGLRPGAAPASGLSAPGPWPAA